MCEQELPLVREIVPLRHNNLVPVLVLELSSAYLHRTRYRSKEEGEKQGNEIERQRGSEDIVLWSWWRAAERNRIPPSSLSLPLSSDRLKS